MIYYGKGGKQYNLSDKPLASGGEGEIFDINGQSALVAKIYKPHKLSPEKERKLISMVGFPLNQNLLTQIAWPQDVLYDSMRTFFGFVMPKMAVNEDLNVIYEPGASSKYPHMPWENKINIAENLCVVLHTIHENGHVCGDLNPKNISVNPKLGFVVFLDTDSYHIQDGANTYRCDVGITEYLPAEVQRKMRGGSDLARASLPTFSQETDNFALAIHIFQLLMNGAHPFACAIIPSHSSVTAPQPSDNIEKGAFPFMQNIPGIKIPGYAPSINILPKDIQDLFKRAFIDGHGNPNARPKPAEWHTVLRNLKQNLKNCKKITHHQYYNGISACPWCAVDEAFSKTQSVVLTQTQITPPVSPTVPRVTAPTIHQPAAPSVSRPPYSITGTRKNWFQRNLSVVLTVIIISVGAVLLMIYQTESQPESTENKQQPMSTSIAASPDLPVPDGFVFIPGGTFRMGTPRSDPDYDPDEGPQRKVTISSFYMAKYEVTQKEYEEVMGWNNSRFKGPNLPAEQVSWYDAVDFCNKKSEKEGLEPVYMIDALMRISVNENANGKPRYTIVGDPIVGDYIYLAGSVTADWSKNGYRLPTSAEWEYAAKGGDGSPGNFRFAGSDNINAVAWYSGNSGETTHEVGTRQPNGLSIYDMTGNVWEWCWDRPERFFIFQFLFPFRFPRTNPIGPEWGTGWGTERVMRGGSYSTDNLWARSTMGYTYEPNRDDNSVGIRLVRGGYEVSP